MYLCYLFPLTDTPARLGPRLPSQSPQSSAQLHPNTPAVRLPAPRIDLWARKNTFHLPSWYSLCETTEYRRQDGLILHPAQPRRAQQYPTIIPTFPGCVKPNSAGMQHCPVVQRML